MTEEPHGKTSLAEYLEMRSMCEGESRMRRTAIAWACTLPRAVAGTQCRLHDVRHQRDGRRRRAQTAFMEQRPAVDAAREVKGAQAESAPVATTYTENPSDSTARKPA
jgi:hypothetical protein